MTSPFRRVGTDYTLAQVRGAWLVHVFTTLGIVAAMIALRDVLVGEPDHAIIWLLVTLVIDGVDGPIARALEVEKRVPGLDGFLLDLIIDYVTCVIVPACFMYEFGVVPQDNAGVAVLAVMVFTSAIWFARKDMMTEDNWFRGQPASWNLIAPVMFLLETRTWVGSIIILVLSLLSLTNAPFPHMARARWMRPVTLSVAAAWVGAITAGSIVYPGHSETVRIVLIAGTVYFLGLSVARALHDARARRLGADQAAQHAANARESAAEAR